MEETFSPSQDMANDVGKLLEVVEMTWGTRLLSRDMDSYWRKWASVVTHKYL